MRQIDRRMSLGEEKRQEFGEKRFQEFFEQAVMIDLGQAITPLATRAQVCMYSNYNTVRSREPKNMTLHTAITAAVSRTAASIHTNMTLQAI